MEEVNASCLAVEAGRTIMIQREQLLDRANAAGISIVALGADGKVPEEGGGNRG